MANAEDLEAVKALLARAKDELIRRYEAEGVAIGKRNPKDRGYVIVVYLRSKQLIPGEPGEVEGVPLKFEVTGRFKTQ